MDGIVIEVDGLSVEVDRAAYAADPAAVVKAVRDARDAISSDLSDLHEPALDYDEMETRWAK